MESSMNFQKEISSLIAPTPNYTLLEASLDNFAKQGATKDEITEGKRAWGRKQLPQRILNSTSMIITNATYCFPTQFKKLENEIALGISFSGMCHLLDHVSDLCLESGWAPYGCLVVDQNKITTVGFYTWYRKRHPSPTFIDDATILAKCTAECAAAHPPRAHEIAVKFAEYIYKHGL